MANHDMYPYIKPFGDKESLSTHISKLDNNDGLCQNYVILNLNITQFITNLLYLCMCTASYFLLKNA